MLNSRCATTTVDGDVEASSLSLRREGLGLDAADAVVRLLAEVEDDESMAPASNVTDDDPVSKGDARQIIPVYRCEGSMHHTQVGCCEMRV